MIAIEERAGVRLGVVDLLPDDEIDRHLEAEPEGEEQADAELRPASAEDWAWYEAWDLLDAGVSLRED
jgi:hypothetical protein